MSIREELQDAIEQDLESEVETGNMLWRGLNIACLPLSSEESYRLGLGPLVEENSMSFRVRKNAFSLEGVDSGNLDPDPGQNNAIPFSAGHIITYQQVDWQVDTVKADSFGAFWLVRCVSANS